MIDIEKINESSPYIIFKKYYEKALKNKEQTIEAILVASINNSNNEVDARCVNLKYIIDDEWIFFTNYNSPKAKQFESHNQISAVIFWPITNVQIRIKALISKTSDAFSDRHFLNRNNAKNALAISSFQSQPIKSYDDVIKNYNNILNSNDSLKRPEYWGGYSFIPYYFEFWEGDDSRLNKRNSYELISDEWMHSVLQP